MEHDIWPVADATTFETVFPEGFNPEPMACTVGTDEKIEANFLVYPNPSNGSNLTLSLSNASQAEVEIMDVLGKVVYSSIVNQNISNLNIDLDAGNYFIKVETKQGTDVHKLIVE